MERVPAEEARIDVRDIPSTAAFIACMVEAPADTTRWGLGAASARVFCIASTGGTRRYVTELLGMALT